MIPCYQRRFPKCLNVLPPDCTGPTQAFFKFLPRAGYGLGGPKSLTDLRLDYDHRMVYSSVQFQLTPEMRAKLVSMFPPKHNATDSSYLNEGWDKAGWLFVLQPIAELDNKVIFGKKIEGGNKSTPCSAQNQYILTLCPVECTFAAWAPESVPRNKAQILEFIQTMAIAPGYDFPPWISNLFDILCHESVDEPIIGIYPARTSMT